ncbi:RHE_PE00001 family protein [Neorhizobium alkalisoli]|uniref:RHE_PE00001 family protein n=1 Tax=Neorhizobium alkalisoli TaxID=528178 RepID=UPI000CF88A83|nr:RHE_PE00001 family protein [Neorhizobium alkalisoli]
MRYELSKLPLQSLLSPLTAATSALARLDERIGRSPLGAGWSARTHFSEACASLWVDGELIHLEDLVLYDAGMSARAPTHELTIAHDLLRTRRRILSNPPQWALSIEGLRSLRGRGGGDERFDELAFAPTPESSPEEGEEDDDPLAVHLAAIDAVLARSELLLAEARTAEPQPRRERDPLVYETDWDEDERLEEWQAVVQETEGLPPLLRAALLLDAWNVLQVFQHAPWLGRQLPAAFLRQLGATNAHLATINLGLKQIARERRADRNRDTRLKAFLDAITLAAELGLKEHDRLLLAKQQMQHRAAGKRQSSKLPQLIDLVLSTPMVSAGMIAEALRVTPQGALKIAAELSLRELTGRGRFRAWGVI